MEENKKVVVNLPEGASTAEVTIREGEAPKVLEPKAPVKINLSGVIGAPVEYLTHRAGKAEPIQRRTRPRRSRARGSEDYAGIQRKRRIQSRSSNRKAYGTPQICRIWN